MFVFSEWEKICKEIAVNHNCITANQILEQINKPDWIVVKHDVETDVSKALSLAKIENKYGIRATYYVQSYLLQDNFKKLQEIQELGHEVTYHYDVLDSNNGDFELATREFEETINNFKEYGFNVKTVCPHGNPIMNRNGWDSNKDFFRRKDITDKFCDILDIVVHLPSKINYKYTYISDAGYSWKIIVNIADNDKFNKGDKEIKNIYSLLEKKNNSLIISTHPHRWRANYFFVLLNKIKFKFLRLIARTLNKIPFFKKLMSRFYYLAKKI